MKIPSYFFGLTYVLSIFIFAIIFNTMPYEFYHSTSKYEKVLNTDIIDLHNNVTSVIKSNLKKSYNSDTAIVKTDTFLINSIWIQDVELNKNTVKFLYLGSSYSGRNSKLNGNILSLNFNSDPPDTLQNGQVQYITSLCSSDTNSSKVLFVKNSDLFRIKNLALGRGHPDISSSNCPECVDCGLTILPDTLKQKLIHYSNALEGFPSLSSGNFERMFYLSAVTITTVGYGDIVPITPRTRMLISIEAIWGIVLIGLFLNSLANKISARK